MTGNRFCKIAPGPPIVDPDGNTYYGYTQEEVDAEYTKTLKDRQDQAEKEHQYELKSKAECLDHIQCLIDDTDHSSVSQIVGNIVDLSEVYYEGIYFSEMYYSCLRSSQNLEEYVDEHPTTCARPFTKYETDWE